MIDRAIILAAGFGKRLLPLTLKKPKCLVKINKKPLLDIWLEKLTYSKFKKFLINTHHLSSKVEQHIKKSIYRQMIKISFEKELLGTAKTIIRNSYFCENNDCLILHADNYSEVNIANFIKAHNSRPKKCVMSMLIFKTKDFSNTGIISRNKSGIIIDMHEKKNICLGGYANGAIYIITPQMLDEINNKYSDAKDFSTDIIPKFFGRIYSYQTSNFFIDIGNLKNLEIANNHLKNYKYEKSDFNYD